MSSEWDLIDKGDKKANGTFVCTCLYCKKSWTGDAQRVRAHFGAVKGVGAAPCAVIVKNKDKADWPEGLRNAVALCEQWQSAKDATSAAKLAEQKSKEAAERSRKAADELRKGQLSVQESFSGNKRARDAPDTAQINAENALLKWMAKNGIPFSAAEARAAAPPAAELYQAVSAY
jgi:hypothetical protein